MKKTIVAFFAISVASMVCQLVAAPMPTLSPASNRFTFAVPVKKAPVIDGRLEKEFWDNVPRAKFFQVQNLSTTSLTKQTSFRIAHDSKYLYLGATMWESNPELMKKNGDWINFIFSHTYNREGNWQDSPYMFLRMSADGVQNGFYNELPGKVEKPLKYEKGDWITVCTKDKTRWYMESRVPLSMLGIKPDTTTIFLNVRRDLSTGPKEERETVWSAFINGKLATHSFGTLHILKNPVRIKRLEERINGHVRAGFINGTFKDLVNRRGEYIRAKQAYGNLPEWKEAEKIVDRLGKAYTTGLKAYPWCISDEFEDLYMEWKRLLNKLEKSAPTTPFAIETNQAKILSVKLNGAEVKAVKGSYAFSLVSGLNRLEIMAEAAGAAPGVKFNLKNSPETAQDFAAAAPGTAEKDFKKADNKNGWLWSGNQKKLVFRQNLIWNRQYGNHPYAFIGPHVKVWGVSPGETMFFIHNVYNPNKTGKCDYKLIVEVPEGFTRVNDRGDSTWRHYTTKNVKTEKITFKGKKYIRYTYSWTLPQKLIRNLKSYAQYISFRHDGYKFAKGETVDFRFRRIVDGNTTDVVNTIKVQELPPIKGAISQKITFPQYHPFMNSPVSREQYQAVVEDGIKAGLNSYIMVPIYPINQKNLAGETERNFQRNIVERPGMKNYTWALFNTPLVGAGKETHLAALLKKYPDLEAVYFNNTGCKAPDWMRQYCFSKALGKYRKEFREALKKDYEYMFTKGNVKSRDFFMNDESYPYGPKKDWNHCWCFCADCKADFRAMFKIPASEKLDDETIVTKYTAQWNKWWKQKQKNIILGMTHQIIRELGGTLWYYHNTHDHEAYEHSKGNYDIVSIPIPGQTFPGSLVQGTMDAAKQIGEKITGVHNSFGQFHTYWPGEAANPVTHFSSDSNFYHPKEQKQVLVRLAATTHKGAIIESAAYCSAGTYYYMGEAMRLIAAYEDLFHDGVRDDKLATSGTFKYPNMLVLKKGDERLVLIFNEDHKKPLKGVLKNLNLKPGQKAAVWESGKPYGKADSMTITVPPQDVVAVHIK